MQGRANDKIAVLSLQIAFKVNVFNVPHSLLPARYSKSSSLYQIDAFIMTNCKTKMIHL